MGACTGEGAAPIWLPSHAGLGCRRQERMLQVEVPGKRKRRLAVKLKAPLEVEAVLGELPPEMTTPEGGQESVPPLNEDSPPAVPCSRESQRILPVFPLARPGSATELLSDADWQRASAYWIGSRSWKHLRQACCH